MYRRSSGRGSSVSPCTRSKETRATSMGDGSVSFETGRASVPASEVGSVLSTSPGRRAPRGLTYRSTRRPASVSKTDDSRRAGATARAPEAPPLPRARVSASTSVSASRPCREQPRTNERRSATTGEHRARARPRAVGIMVVETTEQRVTFEGARLDARVPRRGVRGRREEDGLSRPQTGFLFESSQTEKKPTIDFARLSDPSKKVQPKSRPRACAIFSPPKSIKSTACLPRAIPHRTCA